MVGYPELTEQQLKIRVGMTSRLYHDGCTPDEIAKKIRRPISEVKEWISWVQLADKARADR